MNIFSRWFKQIREAPLDKDHSGGDQDTVHKTEALDFNENWYQYKNGYYAGAKRVPLHPGRLGGDIIPRAFVVHTTDTMPGGFAAIVKSWGETRGLGNAATFLLGRTPEDGLVQFAPITKNTNHAGGIKHGWWKDLNGRMYHPNSVSVGVEVDNGGLLKLVNGKIIHSDTKREVHPLEVYWDTHGRPWHKFTEYQITTLKNLILHTKPNLSYFEPRNVYVVSNGDYKSNRAEDAIRITNPWLVGHWTLDPYNKTDPGPEGMKIINELYP